MQGGVEAVPAVPHRPEPPVELQDRMVVGDHSISREVFDILPKQACLGDDLFRNVHAGECPVGVTIRLRKADLRIIPHLAVDQRCDERRVLPVCLPNALADVFGKLRQSRQRGVTVVPWIGFAVAIDPGETGLTLQKMPRLQLGRDAKVVCQCRVEDAPGRCHGRSTGEDGLFGRPNGRGISIDPEAGIEAEFLEPRQFAREGRPTNAPHDHRHPVRKRTRHEFQGGVRRDLGRRGTGQREHCSGRVIVGPQPGIKVMHQRVRLAGRDFRNCDRLAAASQSEESQCRAAQGLRLEVGDDDLDARRLFSAHEHAPLGLEANRRSAKLQHPGAQPHLVDQARESAVVAAHTIADAQGVRARRDSPAAGPHDDAGHRAIAVKLHRARAVVGERDVMPLAGSESHRLGRERLGVLAKTQVQHHPPRAGHLRCLQEPLVIGVRRILLVEQVGRARAGEIRLGLHPHLAGKRSQR